MIQQIHQIINFPHQLLINENLVKQGHKPPIWIDGLYHQK